MEIAEFLDRSTARLERLVGDSGFANELSQLRAKALLTGLASEGQGPDFTFSEARLWRNCQFVLGGVAREVIARGSASSTAQQASILAAETAEYISATADVVDPQQALITASLLYHLAGYEANGICLARNIKTLGTAEDPTGLFIRGIALFLLRRLVELHAQAANAVAELRDQDKNIATAMEQGRASVDSVFALAAGIHIQRALDEIAAFGLTGDDARYAASIVQLHEGIRLLSETGDVERSVIGTSLQAAFGTFYERSTWHCLRALGRGDDPVWHDFLRVLASGHRRDLSPRSIAEFWPSQRVALDAGLLNAERGFVIRMPTSAGKTRIAELAIIDALRRTPNSRCIYVAPFRALAEEIEQSLGQTVGRTGYRVSTVLGSFETDEFENFLLEETDVLITTPEKLDLVFRWQPSYFDKVPLIVLDEGHIIDDPNRGAKYELLLARIKRRTQQNRTRFLFLSAVMSENNAQQFALWLANSANNLAKTEWRPARQLLARFTWQGNRGRATYVGLAPPAQPEPFVPGLIERRHMVDFTPTGRIKQVTFPRSRNKSQTAAELTFRFADQGRLLVFCSQTNYVRYVAGAILEGLRLREQSSLNVPHALRAGQSSAALELSREWLGSNHVLVSALSRGVGIHYGPLPEVVRHAIEDDFRNGNICVLICTNTLAQGVNLPITTAIVHSVTRQSESDAEGRSRREPIKVRDYWNICGRAGRAGVETEGQIIHIVDSAVDRKLFDYYSDRNHIEPVTSRLLVALQELVAGRLADKDLQAQLDADLLAVLVEEAVASPDRAHIEQILGNCLVKIQAEEIRVDLAPLIDRLTIIGQHLFERVSEPERRKVFATTGLSVDSCEQLAEAVVAMRTELETAIANNDTFALAKLAYSACSSLREMQTPVVGPVDVAQFLQDWIAGSPISDLWTRYSEGPRGGARDFERLSRFVEDLFVYRLPWGFNALVKITDFLLARNTGAISTAIRYLASMTKFGLPDHIACWARSLGIPSRASALDLARGYRGDGGTGVDFGAFMQWLAALTPEDLSNRFHIQGFALQRTMERLNRLWIPTERGVAISPLTFSFEIRGLQYEGRREVARGIASGEALTARRETQNPYDANAIAVLRQDQSIGYIPREIARTLALELDLGSELILRVSAVIVSPLQQTPEHIHVAATITRRPLT